MSDPGGAGRNAKRSITDQDETVFSDDSDSFDAAGCEVRRRRRKRLTARMLVSVKRSAQISLIG